MPSSQVLTRVEGYFDKGAIVVHAGKRDDSYPQMLDWVDKNSSDRVNVECLQAIQKDGQWVQSTLGEFRVFFAFKNSDDALFFRIKYGNR
jgi:CRISPR/Cas system-associated protein endoribonuclease Cas2